jgi:hypothetical protein
MAHLGAEAPVGESEGVQTDTGRRAGP